MVSFKNGFLKIKYEGDSKARLYYEISFVANMIALYIFHLVAGAGTVTCCAMFFTSVLIYAERGKTRVVLPYNFIWYSILTAYVSLSNLWSSYVASGLLGDVMRFVIIILMITSIAIYVDDVNDLERIMSLFIWSVFINVALELIYTPVSRWFSGALGTNISLFNANEIAFLAVCAELMAFYKAYLKGEKGYYVLTALFLFFAILTSSRKATVAGVIGLVTIIGLSVYKKNYFLKLLVIIGVAIGIGYLIMTNESLYNSVGRRFTSMFNYFSDDTLKSDNSLVVRKYYIDIAESMFLDSPVVGQGMRNFYETIVKQYGLGGAYVHNNYWQILCEYGLIGFVIYYSFYVYIIVKLIKRVVAEKNKIAIIFTVIMLMLVVLEWGVVTINTKTSQIVIAIAYTATYAETTDTRKYSFIKNREKIGG